MSEEFSVKNGRVDREIMRLTVPTVLSNISVPLLGLCDTAVAGHMGEERYLAGIAVGSVMMTTVFWLFSFLRAGTSGLTASAYGAGDRQRMAYALMRSASLGILIAVAMWLLKDPLLPILRVVIGASREVTELSERYFSIAICGAVPMMVLTSLSGWFVGMQSTSCAMAVNVAMSVLNVASTLTLVYLSGMGFDGIAAGTVAAQWLILIPAICMAVRLSRRHGIRFSFDRHVFFDVAEWRLMFGINTNLFFRSACLIAATMIIYAYGARIGDVEVGANAVINQLFLFFSYFMDGFAYTGEALVGWCHGSGDKDMLRIYVRELLKWTSGVTVVFALLYAVALPLFVSLLSDSQAVARCVENCRVWVVCIPLAGACAFIYDGFYIGITRTAPMLVSTLCGVVLFAALLLTVDNDQWMLWMSFTCYLALRSLILMVMFPYNLNKISSR